MATWTYTRHGRCAHFSAVPSSSSTSSPLSPSSVDPGKKAAGGRARYGTVQYGTVKAFRARTSRSARTVLNLEPARTRKCVRRGERTERARTFRLPARSPAPGIDRRWSATVGVSKIHIIQTNSNKEITFCLLAPLPKGEFIASVRPCVRAFVRACTPADFGSG